MGVIVQKYGGSSVADVNRIRRVAERVARTHAEGHRVVVVVSAMGDTTDELLALARQISKDPHRRELDMLLTAGERISMALLGMALHDLGVQAVSFTGSQSGIITDGAHTNARIVEIRPVRIHDELEKGRVVIVAGYQGVSRDKEVTTLGRGGSDTTAVALAAALDAEVCEICSDVDGVYTADPRIVPAARRLSELSHEEMQELAVSGAKVLNAQAVEWARDKGITIHARSTFQAGPGTKVHGQAPRELRISGIAVENDLLVVRAEPPAGAPRAQDLDAAREQVASTLARHGAWPREWSSAGGALLALVPLDNVHGLPALLDALRALPVPVDDDEGLASVAVVGTGIGASPEPLSRALRALSGVPGLEAGPRGVLSSPLRLLLLVPRAAAAECARTLHGEFVGATSSPSRS